MDSIDSFISHLEAGGVIGYPTETVYGIGASTPEGIEKVYALKQRPKSKPLAANVNSLKMATTLVPWSKALEQLFEALLPGPLTVIVDGVGLRFPAHPLTLLLITQLGQPLWGTSANLSGQPPALTAAEVPFDIPVLDGGRSHLGQPSTVVRLGTKIEVLREGAISLKEIEAVWPIC